MLSWPAIGNCDNVIRLLLAAATLYVGKVFVDNLIDKSADFRSFSVLHSGNNNSNIEQALFSSLFLYFGDTKKMFFKKRIRERVLSCFKENLCKTRFPPISKSRFVEGLFQYSFCKGDY
jgi:hypothetical protein